MDFNIRMLNGIRPVFGAGTLRSPGLLSKRTSGAWAGRQGKRRLQTTRGRPKGVGHQAPQQHTCTSILGNVCGPRGSWLASCPRLTGRVVCSCGILHVPLFPCQGHHIADWASYWLLRFTMHFNAFLGFLLSGVSDDGLGKIRKPRGNTANGPAQEMLYEALNLDDHDELEFSAPWHW